MHALIAFVRRLLSNRLSQLGTYFTAVSGLGILLLAFVDAALGPVNDYASLFMMAVLALAFLLGLVLIPVGFLLDRRRHGMGIRHVPHTPHRLGVAAERAAFIAMATILSLLILGAAGQKTVRVMNSGQFCGTACHTPMQPEWTAYQENPHSQVRCVECHVGSGVVWGLRAKLDGAKRLMSMLTEEYARPIPTPVHGMRAAADTCGSCHAASDGMKGNKVKVYPRYGEDRDNKPAFNVALLYLGGVNPRTGRAQGIHAHADAKRQIRYETMDEKRTRIGRISVYEEGQLVAEYRRPDEKGTPVAERVMDCLDCHNQPSHSFVGTARLAVDNALYNGTLDPKVPYVSKVAVALLMAATPPREQAAEHFRKAVKETYARDHADEKVAEEDLERLARGLNALYQRNIFPDMKVGWGTFRTQLDHRDEKDQVGCFRCHNSDYEATVLASGRKKKLDQDCEACHAMLASEEDPAEMEEALQPLVLIDP
ncbi:MAG: NapC/NirT family cytochrome c [Myxococcota bacterium]